MQLKTLAQVAIAAMILGCQGKPRIQFPSADSAIERLGEQMACSKAVQGEATLAFSGDGRRLNGSVLFLAEEPENLRLDVFSSFGATLSTLTADGVDFGLYSLEDKSFLSGPAKACNVQRFTQVPVAPRALVDLFRGLPPVLDTNKSSIVYESPWFGGGSYVLRYDTARDHEEIRIAIHPDDLDVPLERQRLRLLGVASERDGEASYQVELRGHAPAENSPLSQSAEEKAMGLPPPQASGPACRAELPRELRFYVPKNGYQLNFKTKEIWHNPPLSPDSFQQPVPNGVTHRQSNCSD